MGHPKKETIGVHTFTPLPPLSLPEFERLERLAKQNDTEVVGAGAVENGPYVRLVLVDGNWRLVEQEMKRMGRDFYEPVPYWFNSGDVEPV